jgi:hypothetical protein
MGDEMAEVTGCFFDATLSEFGWTGIFIRNYLIQFKTILQYLRASREGN